VGRRQNTHGPDNNVGLASRRDPVIHRRESMFDHVHPGVRGFFGHYADVSQYQLTGECCGELVTDEPVRGCKQDGPVGRHQQGDESQDGRFACAGWKDSHGGCGTARHEGSTEGPRSAELSSP
jgi:hypothetical protein